MPQRDLETDIQLANQWFHELAQAINALDELQQQQAAFWNRLEASLDSLDRTIATLDEIWTQEMRPCPPQDP